MRITWCVHPPKKHHDRGRIDRTGRPSENTTPPFFYREGAGGQNRATYTTFWPYNRSKHEDVEQARCNINFSCQDGPIGGNRTGEANKQLLSVRYLISLEICTCSFQVGFLGDEQVKKVSKWALNLDFSRTCIGAPHCVHPIAYPWRRLDPMDITYIEDKQ